MKLQAVTHVFLVLIGVVVAGLGLFGIFGFDLGESIIVLVLLLCIDLILRLGASMSSGIRR